MTQLLILKQEVHRQCLLMTEERIRALQREIEELREAAGEQGKSSAGDKHETSRAMTDLEIEKHQVSLKNLLQVQAALKQSDPSKNHHLPSPGSLVETDKGIFYITAGLGKVPVNAQEIMVISPDAPLAMAFGKSTAGSAVNFNGRSYSIIEVV